jgi:hypothetical protein
MEKNFNNFYKQISPLAESTIKKAFRSYNNSNYEKVFTFEDLQDISTDIILNIYTNYYNDRNVKSLYLKIFKTQCIQRIREFHYDKRKIVFFETPLEDELYASDEYFFDSKINKLGKLIIQDYSKEEIKEILNINHYQYLKLRKDLVNYLEN